MKLRRFSQLGWHGCMDLVAAAAGHHVQRVELGEPPKKVAVSLPDPLIIMQCLGCGKGVPFGAVPDSPVICDGCRSGNLS